MRTTDARVPTSARPILALVVVASMLAACGGSSPSIAESSASAAASVAAASTLPESANPSPSGLTEMTPVTIYIGGVTSTAPQAWAAEAEGIFAKYNLEPNFVVLDGTSQAVQAVAAHREGPAYVDGSILDVALVRTNSPDAPTLVAIANVAPLNPVALLFMGDSGIVEPSDLVGKKIGVPTGSLSETYLNVFLENEGVAKDSVTIENIGFSALHPALLQNQVDAIAEFARGIASMSVIAEEQNRTVGSFLFGDYGIPSPLTAVVVQKSLVDDSPAVAQAIASATMDALQFCVLSPEQCIQDFVDLNEGRDYDSTLAEWKLAMVAQYGLDAATAQNMQALQLGWFDPQLVADTIPELNNLFGTDPAIDPTTLYTNQFVQQP